MSKPHLKRTLWAGHWLWAVYRTRESDTPVALAVYLATLSQFWTQYFREPTR